jgi:phage protein D
MADLISQMSLKIGGKDAPRDMMRAVSEIVVDTSLHLPDMFTIRINDSSLKLIDSPLLDVGNSVEITGEAGEIERTVKALLMKGEITAIEPEFTEDGGVHVITRGYVKSHRLHRGKKTRVFMQMSDSDIVAKIAQECGLTAKVEKTSQSHDHVFQNYQTDMEFIQDRAQRVGYFAYVEDSTLYFCSKPSTRGQAIPLEWGKNLVEFQARFTSAEQVSNVEVHGWDIKQKKAIIGKASSPKDTPTVDGESHGGKVAQKAFGMKSEDVVNNRPVWTQGEADILAQSVLDEKCHAFFYGEGTCRGNPALCAGSEIELKGIGKRFSGRYRVTHAIHRYDLSGYTTQFEISGYRANTLDQLLATNGNGSRGYGVVVGIVTNSKDPENLARVKVKYPTISDKLESDWIRVATPMAGPGRGFMFLPEVNDEVLIAFEHGDMDKPYIVGALWNGKDKPPESSDKAVGSDGKVQKRIIQTRSGHIITLDDTDGKENISIIDKTGNNSIEIDSAKNMLTIKTDGPISMETKDDVTIKGKNITLDATADANMKAKSNINLEATSKATMKGTAGANVQSDAQVNVKATAATNIEGATTTVKANTALTIQGTPVKIN